ncbi:MAG: hypothetical protein ACOCYE_09425 [Pseudomonadota bacterium]
MPACNMAHITLNTGDVRISPRHEVDPLALRVSSSLLRKTLASGQPVPVPRCSDYAFQASPRSGGVVATVSLDAGHPLVPVVTFGIFARACGGERLWRHLHECDGVPVLPYATSAAQVPASPWCAVRFERGVSIAFDALLWLGDFERCVAWAHIDSGQLNRAGFAGGSRP